MMILHLANDYSNSTVYKNLISELDNRGLKQIVYTPVKAFECIGRNEIVFSTKGSSIIYSNILNKHVDRVFYKSKINKILRDIESKISIEEIDCIHAHTWYSDGGVAFELYKKYNISYIIAIRNTDLNLFWKLPLLKNYGLRILKNAFKIIFISETYKNRVLKMDKIKKCIENKYEVIPNGVDSFWLNNRISKRYIKDSEFIKILYVGNFNKGKNVYNLIKAVSLLQERYNNIKLSLVGGGGSNHKKIIRLINDNPLIFKYFGRVRNKENLLAIYQDHQLFAMPSRHETFGLVYIEALLQGLPILYTKDEGIDGMYDEEIGEAVENISTEEIAVKLATLIDNLNNYNYDIDQIKKNHDWKTISQEYIEIYQSCK